MIDFPDDDFSIPIELEFANPPVQCDEFGCLPQDYDLNDYDDYDNDRPMQKRHGDTDRQTATRTLSSNVCPHLGCAIWFARNAKRVEDAQKSERTLGTSTRPQQRVD